jgi:P-type Mg2+ transporter
MHAADTSMLVDGAVDVAREAADFVLLERDLDVLRRGIEAGRTTFANTLKYVLTTTSANLPVRHSRDRSRRRRGGRRARGSAAPLGHAVYRALHAAFGALSSAFDLITFGVLLFAFQATVPEFRTGCFVLSLLTELVIALVVRTRRPFYRSRPGRLLWVSTAALAVIALAIPCLPHVELLGFVPLPLGLSFTLVGITAGYVVGAEALKRWFDRRYASATA